MSQHGWYVRHAPSFSLFVKTCLSSSQQRHYDLCRNVSIEPIACVTRYHGYLSSLNLYPENWTISTGPKPKLKTGPPKKCKAAPSPDLEEDLPPVETLSEKHSTYHPSHSGSEDELEKSSPAPVAKKKGKGGSIPKRQIAVVRVPSRVVEKAKDSKRIRRGRMIDLWDETVVEDMPRMFTVFQGTHCDCTPCLGA
jgi:hypothetical protein